MQPDHYTNCHGPLTILAAKLHKLRNCLIGKLQPALCRKNRDRTCRACSNPSVSLQIAETAVLCRKNGAYNARIVQLYMHPCRIQKPKVIPLSVFKLENICLKQEKTVTALAKLSAQASCSISQRIPKSKASGCPLSVFESGNITLKAGKRV